MPRALIRLALACLITMTLVLGTAHARQHLVWLVLSEESGVHAEAGAVLRHELEREARISSGTCATELNAGRQTPALIVTVGTAAFECTLDWLGKQSPEWGRVPVIASLLPLSAYQERLAARPEGPRPMTAVVLDQPPGRQLALIRRALPGYERLGVLAGPRTRPLLVGLQQTAQTHGLRLVTGPRVETGEDVFPALRQTLTHADVLLALPDTLIYNASTLQNILLTTYRARVPMIAFSAAHVRAGALAAVYTTPAQTGRAAAEAARQWLAGRGMPAVQAPREFAVATNPRVATSLGLALDDADQIATDLRRAEQRQ